MTVKVQGIRIESGGITLTYWPSDEPFEKFIPIDKLPDYLAAWLPVFVEVQGMIVRGAEAANASD